jgi:hypothetical protein
MSMSVPITALTISISINHRGYMLASLPRFLLSSAITALRPPAVQSRAAVRPRPPVKTPVRLRPLLASSKGCRPPHLRRPLLPKMVRNRFPPAKYRIDTRRIDVLSDDPAEQHAFVYRAGVSRVAFSTAIASPDYASDVD